MKFLKPTKHNDGDGYCPPPFSNPNGQRHQGKIFYNYGFEGKEERFGSEFGRLGYYGELDSQLPDGTDDGSNGAGQTHRRLWYEDSINDSNSIDLFPVNRLEQSSRVTDESGLQHYYYLNDAQRDTGVIPEVSDKLENGSEFCEIEVNDCSTNALPDVTEKIAVIKTVTVKSDFIQEDKGNVQDSKSYSVFDGTKEGREDFDCNKLKGQKSMKRNNLKRGKDVREFDNVEFVVAKYRKRLGNIPERPITTTHTASEDKVYRELLRGSVVALAIANGSTDVNLSGDNISKQEQNKMPSIEQPDFVFQREKKRSFKPKDYNSLVNEHRENMKPKLSGQHSIIKRINKKRRDSKQRFKNSVIGKQTRKLSKKVVNGLKKVTPKTKRQTSRHLPVFVIASV